MHLNRTHTFTAGLLGGALTLGAFNIASASSKTTINSCVNKTTGTMRYLSKGKCAANETSLSWNVTGPQGLVGLQGPRGENGPSGLNGATGPTGEIGATGAIGPAGATGATGPTGSIGATGLGGATGSIGATGSTGPKGERGDGRISSFNTVIEQTLWGQSEQYDSALQAATPSTPVYSDSQGIEIRVGCFTQTWASGYRYMFPGYILDVTLPTGAIASAVISKPTQGTSQNERVTPYFWKGDGSRRRIGYFLVDVPPTNESLSASIPNIQFWKINIYGPSLEPVVLEVAVEARQSIACQVSGMAQTR